MPWGRASRIESGLSYCPTPAIGDYPQLAVGDGKNRPKTEVDYFDIGTSKRSSPVRAMYKQIKPWVRLQELGAYEIPIFFFICGSFRGLGNGLRRSR